MGIHDVVKSRHGDFNNSSSCLPEELILPFELDEDFALSYQNEEEAAEHIAGVVEGILPLIEAMSVERSSAKLRILDLMDADQQGPEFDDVQLAPFLLWPAVDVPVFRATLKLTNDTLVGSRNLLARSRYVRRRNPRCARGPSTGRGTA
ncbi:hypothetical protein AB5I41_15015 [Sphingomonas sp. MMS24-JH45]